MGSFLVNSCMEHRCMIHGWMDGGPCSSFLLVWRTNLILRPGKLSQAVPLLLLPEHADGLVLHSQDDETFQNREDQDSSRGGEEEIIVDVVKVSGKNGRESGGRGEEDERKRRGRWEAEERSGDSDLEHWPASKKIDASKSIEQAGGARVAVTG
ncbi:hypothetical protein R1flu_020980 [Riccia fluitans]|uniref:Uncharacterized protein n=1 Tax=Riccia fluitans TaxID=41844 RepID=A0ABD1ZP89_9MARC